MSCLSLYFDLFIRKDCVVLVDSHAHMDTSRFQADREAVIQAAIAGGVTRIVDPGIDLASSRSAVALAKSHPGTIFAGVGVHPHDATTYSDEVGLQFRAMAQEPEVVAIGELDSIITGCSRRAMCSAPSFAPISSS